jgi:diacylglycerol kinase (ATP)
MRIHLGMGILACAAAGLLPLAGGERALLLLAVALVVAGEAANSALEAVVDLVSPGPDERAKVAKDAAAGAVLALAAGSVVVLLSVAVPAWPSLRGRFEALSGGVLGALVAALSAVLLPSPGRRSSLVDLALFLLGAAGLVAVGFAAEDAAGVAGAALLLALAAGAAVRRRRGVDRTA